MSTTSSNDSSFGPVRQGRGRGRGGRRGTDRSRSRSGARGRGRGADMEEVEAGRLLQTQQDELKEEVNNMSEDNLRMTLCRAIDAQPGLIFDIMRPANIQPGWFHPQPGGPVPDWCVCGQCRDMPTQLERLCCGKHHCVSQNTVFELLVLNESVLALARLYRRDLLVFVDDVDMLKANRHQAYRQFILWEHGRLGSGNRRVVPSCCVWKIRDKFPDPYGQYTGFIPDLLSKKQDAVTASDKLSNSLMVIVANKDGVYSFSDFLCTLLGPYINLGTMNVKAVTKGSSERNCL